RLATAYKRGPSGALAPTTHWRLGASEGAGGIYSSLRDMSRYAAFQLSAYPPRSAPDSGPVRRSSVREAHASAHPTHDLHVSLRASAQKGENLVSAAAGAYGFAWGVRDTCDFDDIVAHNGAVDGYASVVTLLPGYGVGVVALTNSGQADLDRVAMEG